LINQIKSRLTKLVFSVNLGYQLIPKTLYFTYFFLSADIYGTPEKINISPSNYVSLLSQHAAGKWRTENHNETICHLSTTFHFCVDGRVYDTLLRSILYSISPELLRNSKIIVTNICLGPGSVAY